jgi:RNA polymerase sigma-70 factor (ECF subfamily)
MDDPSGVFESIFKQNHKALAGLAYNLIGDADAARDVVQDVFYKLWKRKESISIEPSIVAYLKQATTHASYNYIEQKKNRLKILSDVMWPDKASSGGEPGTYQELEAKAQRAIDKLPPKCKVIFLLSRHEQMKYREIAEHLNISLKTVENQMGIALEKLRNDLKPYLTREFIVPALILLLVYLTIKTIL